MSILDRLIVNPGFHLVAEQIYSYLDPQSLANCRSVSRQWKAFIDGRKWKSFNSVISLKMHQLITKQQEILLDLKEKYRGFPLSHEELERSKMSNEFFCKFFISKLKTNELQPVLAFLREWVKATDDRIDNLRFNIFQYACYHGADEVVKLTLKHLNWIEANIYLNATNDYRYPLLMYLVAVRGKYKVMELCSEYALQNNIDIGLIRIGADGNLLLHNAIMAGQVEVVKVLLKYHDSTKNYKIHIKSTYAEATPLSMACSQRKDRHEILEAILDYFQDHDQEIDMEPLDSWGNNPLHNAIENDLPNITRVLLTHPYMKTRLKSLIDAEDSRHSTPLQIACRWAPGHRTEIIEALLKYALDNDIDLRMNVAGERGMTPLQWCCFHGIAKNVKLFLEYHRKKKTIDINATDFLGRTPLHIACEAQLSKYKSDKEYHKIVKSLLNFSHKNGHEIDLSIRDNAGRTPLQTARHSGEKKSAFTILNYKAKAFLTRN